MSGRLKHRPVSSSRSVSSISSAARGNNGLASANQLTINKKSTRSRTDSGERLPERDRPTIKAVGEHWEVHPYQRSRKPPTVIGALVREMYPDVVDSITGMKPVLTWNDYKRTSTAGESNDKRVLAEFWWRFKCLPEDRAEAEALLELKFKNMVPKMLSEEKQAVTKKLYKDGNVPPEDVDENGNCWPTKEALIAAKPIDFTTVEGWRLLCEHWCTPKLRKASLNASANRLAGGNTVYHHSGSRSLPATRQYLALKTGVDPGLSGAWLHNHELNPGTKDGRLCNEIAADRWAQYEEGMEKKYGPNWKAENHDFDGGVIYECVGRMPHGKLRIGDEAISIAEKEEIKTRKRSAQPYVSTEMKRLRSDNEKLRKENSALHEVERVLRALVAKGGMDYDALAQETATNLATSESEARLTREHDNFIGRTEAEQENTNHGDEDDDNNGGEDYDNDDDDVDDGDYGKYDDEDYGYEDRLDYEDDDVDDRDFW